MKKARQGLLPIPDDRLRYGLPTHDHASKALGLTPAPLDHAFLNQFFQDLARRTQWDNRLCVVFGGHNCILQAAMSSGNRRILGVISSSRRPKTKIQLTAVFRRVPEGYVAF